MINKIINNLTNNYVTLNFNIKDSANKTPKNVVKKVNLPKLYYEDNIIVDCGFIENEQATITIENWIKKIKIYIITSNIIYFKEFAKITLIKEVYNYITNNYYIIYSNVKNNTKVIFSFNLNNDSSKNYSEFFETLQLEEGALLYSIQKHLLQKKVEEVEEAKRE